MTIKDTEEIGAAPFTSSPALRSAVIFARNPKRDQEMMFVTRIFFDSYMDFFVYDLINGMSHGHAPSKCQCCGRYFLTTTGHSPKYCDGMAPQNPTTTCRQYGARQGQKEDNPDHPIYRLFSTHTNAIRKHAERKKIDAETRAALELARDIPKVRVKVTAFERITKDSKRGAISKADKRRAKDYIRDKLYEALRRTDISVDDFEARVASERVYSILNISRTAKPRGRPKKTCGEAA